MSEREFTLADLKRILFEGAGAEGAALDGDILDTSFDALGYESLALLETGGRIEREYGITLGDSVITDGATPRALVEAVNAQLAVTTTAT
ncbi:actinorhodin polyketide synthase [Streptomyces abyssalis]|uniref:Actinorhodin polyketide synthase n=1 Tax=Streptomyces abyssalis TaxID=933944 RepID=A0A1E7JGQ5_9ACTN|nr:acyl carrier protein [Streptomyces abyssalis]OEU85658.1 actinorhodin polyketide synthase [Streptomyces abyssalis]OEU92878.1 actinorhodin polyketide synthase [Streptomyces abyssalis]OEV30504.1 actinorhodin polyketide synthase [Streptomyces nanshensis]